ncbi:hypothetical protein V2J09_020508 [Rumex salicifolius]
MDKRSSLDIPSDLPSSLIDSILERLPIKDAIKTSILSRQWRYTWATLPHLVFDDRCATSSGEDEHDEFKLIDFINQALLLHKGPIFKFKLQVSFMEDCHYIHQWLLFLSRKEIRMLILDFVDYENDTWFCIPSSLYSYQNLCELSPPPPNSKGFSCLRCLILREVYLLCRTIESLVANSPLLEELKLHCLEKMELRILAPNLKNLHIRSVLQMNVCLNAPNLAKLLAEGPLEFTTEHLQHKSSVCSYSKFLGSFTNLEELIADILFDRAAWFLKGIGVCQNFLIFYHLRIIDLSLGSFDDMKKLPSINAPPSESEVDSASIWESVCAANFTFARLKIIEIKGVCDAFNEMEFIKFMLASSPVLEKMILNPDRSLTDQRLLNMTTKLLRCRRASANAEIVLSKQMNVAQLHC